MNFSITPGYPSEPGMYFLWHEQAGWPVIDVLRVEHREGVITYWKGTGGTDRVFDLPRMYGFEYTSLRGHSLISEEALAYFEERHKETSRAVADLIAKKFPTTCEICQDTHRMTVGDRSAMCTHCPIPCQRCRSGGIGAFCATTPCMCECHLKGHLGGPDSNPTGLGF